MKLIRSNYTFEAYVYNSSRQQQKPLICQDFMTTCCLDWSPHQVPETFCWQGGSDSRRRGKAASWWRRQRSWTPRTGSYHTGDTIHPQRRLNWNMSAQLLYLTDITSPALSSSRRHSAHVLSMKCPNRIGPGILPKIRAIIVCSPTAIDLFSIWTLLRVAEVLGREIRKVRNILEVGNVNLEGWGDISPAKY